jgi:hypothetical protein
LAKVNLSFYRSGIAFFGWQNGICVLTFVGCIASSLGLVSVIAKRFGSCVLTPLQISDWQWKQGEIEL